MHTLIRIILAMELYPRVMFMYVTPPVIVIEGPKYTDHNLLTNSMAYGTRRFNAAFTRALQ